MNKVEQDKSYTPKQRWVVKIGSALLTANGTQLTAAHLAAWADQIARLRTFGIDVVLVSSGAVAAGMSRLDWSERPKAMSGLQAAAAVGQSALVRAWEEAFAQNNILVAQILLDNEDLANRQRYLNARSTICTLLDEGVLPIINENDSVVTDEIRLGDNDTLAGLVSNLVNADQLVLLTDQAGLFEADPRVQPDAALVAKANASDELLTEFAGESKGELGRGGMKTKVKAARLAARSGTNTFIGAGLAPDILVGVQSNTATGTYINADTQPVLARKQWLAGQLKPKGDLVLDDGAVRSLCSSGASLLAVGVVSVSGDFRRGDLVRCLSKNGQEIARGLVNYGHAEVATLAGYASEDISRLLGYMAEEELIHRDNLAVLEL